MTSQVIRNKLKIQTPSIPRIYCLYRQFILFSLYLTCISSSLSGQVVPDHPDLGLHGQVTWLSNTKIRVEYDWSDDSQLLDWTATNGSTLVSGNGIMTISGGEALIRSAIWKQLLKCTRIYARDARVIYSHDPHLTFVTNVAGYTGYNSNPPEIIGIIYRYSGNLWCDYGINSSLWGPPPVSGEKYTIDFTISESILTAQSSSNNIVYTHNLSAPPRYDRQVAIGGSGGDTEWGKLTIEGEINLTWPTPADMIDIQSCGDSFSPVIEVTGNPVVEWVFNDGTTSSSVMPVKDYGSIGIRHNFLRVTPWSALVGINLGYDGNNGGYGNFTPVRKQNILGISNLSLARISLRYLCSSYSPLPDLNLTGFTSLEFLELADCYNLGTLILDSHPSLERICVEDCNLLSIDLSGCQGLADYRGANNRYPSINWGDTGARIRYIGLGPNPQFTSNLPDLLQFPMLQELFIWDSNQTGAFSCHNPVIERIDASDNHYVSADLTGCLQLKEISLSGSKLAAVNLGTPNNLTRVNLKNCYIPELLTDYVLQLLDDSELINGEVDLEGNAPPTPSGMDYHDNLKSKGWTVRITSPGEFIDVTEINVTAEGGVARINTDNGILQLSAEVFPPFATDKTITWSVTSGSWLATVSDSGLVTAKGNGTIVVRATAKNDPGIYCDLMIVITNQIVSKDDTVFSVGRIIVTETQLVVLLNDNFLSWRAELYNQHGVLAASKYVLSDELIFDISDITPGIYILVISRGGNVKVAKFIRLRS